MFQPFFQNRPLSSIDGMAAGNPLITAVDAQTIAPAVAYHSIIANIHAAMPIEKSSDGLVSYRSAHLDGAASEQILTDGHSCEANPAVHRRSTENPSFHLEIERWQKLSQLGTSASRSG